MSLFLLPAYSDVESAAPSPVPGLPACYHASRHDETSEAVTLAVHLISTLSPPFSGLAPTDSNEDGAPSPKGRMGPEESQKHRGCTVAVEEGKTPHR